MSPSFDSSGRFSGFNGWSRMGLQFQNFTIIEV